MRQGEAVARTLAANSMTPATPPASATPRAIGRYRILDELGAGGMGVVYAAYDPELDRKVAIKVLLSGPDDEAGAARLQREAQGLAQLSHPNVVAVHDVGRDARGHVFLAMEFVRGTTLTRWLEPSDDDDNRGARPWRDVLDVFIAAGRGLVAAHREGLVHRDFKPKSCPVV